MAEHSSVYLAGCLERLRAGDANARAELLEHARGRLAELARVMFKGYARLRRWEETDDVLQGALLRLHRALQTERPETPLHFFKLAATQIRRELIDLSRHHFGALGPAAHHDSVSTAPEESGGADTLDPARLAAWTEFHQQAQALPEAEQQVFDLVWYHNLKLTEAAEVLGVSTRTVLRRWQSACLKLHEVLGSLLPELSLAPS
jgi:RNA polymerase sigma-70 factor (ECF subfamily)